MTTQVEFDESFYDKKVWGSSEISKNHKGIDLIKLERLLESRANWDGVQCLEIGCGTGRYLRGLRRILDTNQTGLFGTDISSVSLDIARSLSGVIEYRNIESGEMPWPEATFDVVCFFDVLEHVENPAEFVKSSMRVLKPGGIFHASVPMEGDWRCLWRWFDFIDLHKKTKYLDGQIQRFTKTSLKDVFLGNGLILQSESYSYQVVGNILDLFLFSGLQLVRKFNPGHTHYDIVRQCRPDKPTILSRITGTLESAMYWEAKWLRNTAGMNAHLTFLKTQT